MAPDITSRPPSQRIVQTAPSASTITMTASAERTRVR